MDGNQSGSISPPRLRKVRLPRLWGQASFLAAQAIPSANLQALFVSMGIVASRSRWLIMLFLIYRDAFSWRTSIKLRYNTAFPKNRTMIKWLKPLKTGFAFT